VAEIGADVTRFAPGDAVYGQFFHAPVGAGTYAEYVTVPQTQAITAAPANVRPALAAAVPTAGMAALTMVEEAGIMPGHRVLVVGATGGVGSFTTQLAAARGAHVIVTAGATDADRMRSYGAAEVVDHHSGPVAEQLNADVDALIDVVSDAPAFAENSALVLPGGVALTTVYVADVDALAARGVRAANINARASVELLDQLRGEIDAGRLRVPLTAEIPLEGAPEAVAGSRTGRSHGKTVIVL
jgi:NADPH:quinone reductase-like Zn-dependent oxidoreductase